LTLVLLLPARAGAVGPSDRLPACGTQAGQIINPLDLLGQPGRLV